MKNKKGFTLVELLVSFTLITAISLGLFKTVLTLQEQQLKNIARNNLKSFTFVLNKLIQEDFINDKIESIVACGNTCYDIIYRTKGLTRLGYDEELNAIVYGNKKEKMPQDYKLIGKIEFNAYSKDMDGINSYIVLNINLKNNFDNKIENIKYMYQYDKEETNIELDLEWNGAKYIKSLLDNEVVLKNGLIVDETADENIRYRGETSSVKNNVYFNCKDKDDFGKIYGSKGYSYQSSCEVWKIIGIFDIKQSELEEAVPRIKIVQSESIVSKPWDTKEDEIDALDQWGKTTLSDGKTPYPGASLMQYLNIGEYSYYNSLSNTAKNQISDALWDVGVVKWSGTIEPLATYNAEKSGGTGSSTIINYTTKWLGKIGLIHLSDFGYAGTNCTNLMNNSCGTLNWMSTSSLHWTITPSGWVAGSGRIFATSLDSSYSIRPVVYLKSNIQIVGGDGDTDPYILSV